jgi:hypothetical protein
MNIVAYCEQRYEQATRQAVGKSAMVLTCTPVFGEMLTQYATEFAAADLVYFNLHGVPGVTQWYISEGHVAVNAEQLMKLDLQRAVVFMVNCYAGGGLLDVLKAMKPRAIIGGYGENRGGVEQMAGADVLGLWVRRGLEMGMSAPQALLMGKARLTLMPRTVSVKDALQFEVLG